MNYVWEYSETTGADRLMLLALADSCNDDGEWSPGVTTLAAKCRVSERAAQYTLRRLQEMGEVAVLKQQGFRTKTGNTNKYVMARYRTALTEKRTQSIALRTAEDSAIDKGVKPIAPLEYEGVQPTAPLRRKGVKPIAPLGYEGVQPTAPVGVQPIAPDPPVLTTSIVVEGESTRVREAAPLSPLANATMVAKNDTDPIPVNLPTPPVAAPLPAQPTIGVITTGDPLMDQAVARSKGEWNRRDKRHLDDLVKQVTGLGMTMTDFRAMVDAFLEKYGRREMAALDTDLAARALSKAQDVVLSLCGIDARFRSVAGMESVFASWRENDYRGATLPDGSQIVEHAGKMKAGAVVNENCNQKGQTPHASNTHHRNSSGRPEQPAHSAGSAAPDFSRYNRNRANRQPTTGA